MGDRLELIEYGASGEVLYAAAPLPCQALVGPEGRRSLTEITFVWLRHGSLCIVRGVSRKQPDLFHGSKKLDGVSENSISGPNSR